MNDDERDRALHLPGVGDLRLPATQEAETLIDGAGRDLNLAREAAQAKPKGNDLVEAGPGEHLRCPVGADVQRHVVVGPIARDVDVDDGRAAAAAG